MACPNMPRMSLCAQFDDLCRFSKVMSTGCESEFKIFVESQLSCVRKLKETETDVRELKRKISCLQSEKGRLETQMKHLKNLCESEVNKRKAVEKERNSMENQIALIKEVLLADRNMDNQTREKLAFLSSSCKPSMNSPPRLETIEESVASLLSLSDVDRTEDDLGERRSSSRRPRRSKGKRSSSDKKASPPKKKKSDTTESEDNDLPETCNLPYLNVGVRSNSEPTSKTPDIPIINYVHRSDSDQFKCNTYDCRRSNTGNLAVGTPVGRYSTGGKLSRCHMFTQKTAIRTEKCNPCGRNIKFCKVALKCQDCRVICHPECKELCSLPCIPTINTPTKGTVGSIADYTSSTPPMIPALIVHCVNEIESRGLREIGLYRISGSEREVRDLKEKFLKGRAIPNLNQVDIHAVCGTVKEFLRSLKEPLIPKSAWQTFVDAAELSDEALSLNVLYEAVSDLPQANKDTLSFLMLHLHRVAESPDCKMPIENLAKIFGPTIVGYSTTSSDANMFRETPYQHKVMERLLSIASDAWQNLLNVETDVFQPLTSTCVKTPETLPAPRGTMLGPIYSDKKARTTLGRTPLTPRNSKFSKSSKMMSHFASPHVK